MTLIGISGPAGSGKTTLAAMLAAEIADRGYSVTIEAFALGLKRQARQVMGWPGRKDEFWRRCLQVMGDHGRLATPGRWIRELEARVATCGADHVLVPDVRYEDEARLVRRLGTMIHVRGRAAPLAGEAATHSSEAGIEQLAADIAVHNTGSLDALRQIAHVLVENGILAEPAHA